MIKATWAELVIYLFTVKKLDRSNERVIRGRFSTLNSYFSKREYNEENVHAFFAYLEKDLNYRPGSMNNYIKLMRHLNRFLIKKERLEKDFMSDFAYFKVVEPYIEPLSPEEMERLIVSAYEISFMLGVMTETLYYTGMRNAEMYKLKWDDIRGNHLVLRNTKDGEIQYVLVPPTVKDKINLLPHYPHGHIFGTEQRPMYQQKVNLMLQKAADRAGLKGHMHAHKLRHSVATAVARTTNSNGFKVKEFMRHKNIITTQRYVHLNDQDREEALQGIKPDMADERTIRNKVSDLYSFISKTKYKSTMHDVKRTIVLTIDLDNTF